MKIFTIFPTDLSEEDWNYSGKEEVKCGGCNWAVTKLYVLAESRSEAVKLVKEGLAGLCSECFMEMIVQQGFELKHPAEKRKGKKIG
jgi:hypothetical protein